jgi:putative transposase
MLRKWRRDLSPAPRLKHRDYSSPGLYFITICTDFKRCIFGEVQGERVQLSALGRIVHEGWEGIPSHFARVRLHESIVMPNHVHGIVEIVQELTCAQHAAPLHGVAVGPALLVGGSLSVIVRSFKAEVARRAHLELNWNDEIWLRNYFDRVIRDGREFSDASRYIAENPVRWQAQRKKLVEQAGRKERLAQHAAPLQSRWRVGESDGID